jgi:hypothetical protein
LGVVSFAGGAVIVIRSFAAFKADRWAYIPPTYQGASAFQLAVVGGLFIILGIVLFWGTPTKAD